MLGVAELTGQLLTVERVAELTGLSRRSVYRAVEASELVAYRLRGRVRIPESALEDWLAGNLVTPRRRPRPDADASTRKASPSEVRRLLLPDA